MQTDTSTPLVSASLIRAATRELINLRSWATNEERARISYTSIAPPTTKSIYGILANGDNSDRAVQLLSKCAIPFCATLEYFSVPDPHKGFEVTFGKRNFSPLEFLVVQKGDFIPQIIDFLHHRMDELPFAQTKSFIEDTLKGIAPLQQPTKTEREIILGLRSAIETSNRLLMETGLTGQLCDVADMINAWYKEMQRHGIRH